MSGENVVEHEVVGIEGEFQRFEINGEPAEGAVDLLVDEDNRRQHNGAANSVDPRMQLMDHERNLAINIKEAIARTPEVKPVSDFMCAQLALIDGSNTEAAIERVHHLQSFREEYGFLDTAEDGKSCFLNYIALFPGLHLSFVHVPETGNHVMIYDMNKCHSSKLCSDWGLRAFLGGSYYTCVAFCPDFEAIRSGCIMLMECEGYDWKRNIDSKSLRKVWSEVGCAYPFHFQKVKYFNASNSMVIVANMVKPFIPKYLRGKLEFGCQNEQRLDELYMVPNVEAANIRLIARLQETLDRRYENERTFRL